MENFSDEHQQELQEENNNFNHFWQNRLQRTPWWLISLVIHAILIFMAALIVFEKIPKQVQFEYVIVPVEEDEIIPEPKKDIFKTTKLIKEEQQTIKDPVVKEATVSDAHETADDEDFAEARGLQNAAADNPFEGKFDNSFLGGGSGGGKFGTRFGGRKNLLKTGGGGPLTEKAVKAGLEWLKRHQKKDGAWDADSYSHECNKNPAFSGSCSGHGQSQYDPSVTGMALLCFLGAGNTSSSGKYKKQVKKGVQYLQSIQDKEGCFGNQSFSRHMYNHAIATYAITEAYALSNYNPILKASAQKAIDFLLKVQTSGMGWGYNRHSVDNDTSIMGWCVMALNAARIAELTIPENAFSGAKTFLDSVTASNYQTGYRKRHNQVEFETPIVESNYLFSIAKDQLVTNKISESLREIFKNHNLALSYNTTIAEHHYSEITAALGSSENNKENLGWLITDRGNKKEYQLKNQRIFVVAKKFAASEAMTAVAMNARAFMETDRNDSYLVGGAAKLAQNLPVWGNDGYGYSLINYYYWYHGTLAMFQMQGDYWQIWNKEMKETLVTHQEKEGCKKGSWPPIGKRCQVGGRIYATALSILSLEIYYRYGKQLN